MRKVQFVGDGFVEVVVLLADPIFTAKFDHHKRTHS
jgi:hypothetical protein